MGKYPKGISRLDRKILAALDDQEPTAVLARRRKSVIASLETRGFSCRSRKKLWLEIRGRDDAIATALHSILQRLDWAIEANDEGRLADALFNVVHLYEHGISVKGFTTVKAERRKSARGGAARAESLKPAIEIRDQKILQLDREGLALKVIGGRVHCSVSTVSAVLKKHGKPRRGSIISA